MKLAHLLGMQSDVMLHPNFYVQIISF